ncbi:MAG: ABC transporter ATP-binding protein [Clostridia bacterium]|nr:ABC transporter ATP-binding protein [Clostridia bacterium]
MQKYKKSVKKYWWCFIFAPFFMILEACGEFILPYVNANIIDIGAANKDIPFILQNGLIMASVSVAMLITGVLGAFFAIRGASYLARDVRRSVFNKIQRFSFSNIDDFTTGSLITRITNDITQIQGFTQTLLRGMFRSPVMLIGALIMSFSLNPRLACVIFAVVPILAFAIFMIIKTASPRYTEMQHRIDLLNSNIGETVTNERVIKSFVREEYEKEKFGKVNSNLMDRSISALKVMILLQPVSAFAVNATTLAVVWFAGKQITVGDMTIGTLTAFITYLTQILNGLNMLANIILQLSRAAASDRRISEVLNAKIDLTDDNATQKNKEVTGGEIEFKNVCFRYFKDNEENVLEDINLHIDGGELVGIIGSTGSGKSTLVSLIPRLYDADSGEVKIDGVDVRDLSLYNLRESVAVVLQNNTLFSGTVKENLKWGNENASDEEILKAAQMAQADEFVSNFKNGYDTELEQGGKNLSGGQKQRLCIARAILKKPEILILDDSTSAVDTKTEAKIRAALRSELGGVTKIIIAQRITSVIDADKIIVLNDGKIAGCGTHSQLISDCEEYKEIYYSQKEADENGR